MYIVTCPVCGSLEGEILVEREYDTAGSPVRNIAHSFDCDYGCTPTIQQIEALVAGVPVEENGPDENDLRTEQVLRDLGILPDQ